MRLKTSASPAPKNKRLLIQAARPMGRRCTWPIELANDVSNQYPNPKGRLKASVPAKEGLADRVATGKATRMRIGQARGNANLR